MHMANSAFWYCSLHKQTEAEVLDYTLTQGEDMIAAYCNQRHLIPPGELSCANLQSAFFKEKQIYI